MLWLNWNTPAWRDDTAFSYEGRTYIVLYGGSRNADEGVQHAEWATNHVRELEPFGAGIQLADENTGQRPARFLSYASMARLGENRASRDPQGRFHSWMGRIS